ncbi:hypothetical protein RIF29_31320 [Crotalaria pallida]|uniref:Uncharacterized protein n=1 Tax=Crotalaria pallida TaxID=3830 RepID=A0AAN9I1S4_CROPI
MFILYKVYFETESMDQGNSYLELCEVVNSQIMGFRLYAVVLFYTSLRCPLLDFRVLTNSINDFFSSSTITKNAVLRPELCLTCLELLTPK